MQTRAVGILALLFLMSMVLANAEEISVLDADFVWELGMEESSDLDYLSDEPDVLVVKYADTKATYSLEETDNIGHLSGEPGVIVVKYADTKSIYSLESTDNVGYLSGESNVIVVKYADEIGYTSFGSSEAIQERNLELNIQYPDNGDLILSSTVNVSGTASSPNEITQVIVNGVLATGTSSWIAEIPLSTGANTITVEAVTNTSYNRTESIEVFHYTECNLTDSDGDGVIDIWDQENNTESGFRVNPYGIGQLTGDFNNNGRVDIGDASKIAFYLAGKVSEL
jgi:hypothetical protein